MDSIKGPEGPITNSQATGSHDQQVNHLGMSIQPTSRGTRRRAAMSPQQPPYSAYPMDHHHQQIQQPFVHPMHHMPLPDIVYQLSPGSHDPSSPIYPPQGYGVLPPLQYSPYYGEGSRYFMPTYPHELAIPGVVPIDPHYLTNVVQYPAGHGAVHAAGRAYYSAPGAQYRQSLNSEDYSLASGIAALHINSSTSADGSCSAGDSTALRGREKAAKAITKNTIRQIKYSGHALWVGNLPSRVAIASLKDYFSHDFGSAIVSLFMIPKSNCAFVNYHTEADCTRAIEKFHNSRFQGVQLVCRLRKSSWPGSISSTKGPNADGATSSPAVRSSRSQSAESNREAVVDGEEADGLDSSKSENDNESTSTPSDHAPDRYFVMKSLTMQDMIQSIRTGTWATQKHNEETLNNAYKSADTVYLIFSVNRSREYFGYARMATLIPDGDTSPTDEQARTSRADVMETRITLTPATEHAPKGRIVEDLFRSTILWEAEQAAGEKAELDEETDGQSWGKAFKVEWISTKRIPFYRARGLRNRWNGNKEVKVARDGTEIEPEAGRWLLQLFQRGAAPLPSGPPTASYPPIVRDHRVSSTGYAYSGYQVVSSPLNPGFS